MIKYQVVPFIKTNEYNIVSVSTKVIQVNLGSSASISVGFLSDMGQFVFPTIVNMVGSDYENWGNNDDYITKFVYSTLNIPNVFPFVKTESVNITSISINVNNIKPNSSANIKVIFYTDKQTSGGIANLVLSGSDYNDWGNDDDYIKNYVASQLNIVILDSPSKLKLQRSQHNPNADRAKRFLPDFLRDSYLQQKK
jgi:hypothetical protein